MSSDGIFGAPAGLGISSGPAGMVVNHTAVQLAIHGVLRRSGNRVFRTDDEMAISDAVESLMIWIADQQDDSFTIEDAYEVFGQFVQAEGITMTESISVMSLMSFDYYSRPGEMVPGASRLGTGRNSISGSFLNINIDDTLSASDDSSLSGMAFSQDDAMAAADAVDALGTIPSIDDGMSGADEAVSSSSDIGPQTDDVITMGDAVDMLATQDVADGITAAEAIAQDGAAGVDDTMSAADAANSLGLMDAADGIAAADATTLLGTMSAADAITATDAQTSLGTIATVADGIAAADNTSYTSGGSGPTTLYLLHLNESSFDTQTTAVVNSAPGGLVFQNLGIGTDPGGRFWFSGDGPFGQGLNTEGLDGARTCITSTTQVTIDGAFCFEGFSDTFNDYGTDLVQFSTNGTDGGLMRIRVEMHAGSAGGSYKLIGYAQVGGSGTGFLAFETGDITPLAGVAGMPSGFHWALTRSEAGYLAMHVNAARRAVATTPIAGSLTGYIEPFGSRNRVTNDSNGGYQLVVGEFRGIAGSEVYTGSTYTVPTARFTA